MAGPGRHQADLPAVLLRDGSPGRLPGAAVHLHAARWAAPAPPHQDPPRLRQRQAHRVPVGHLARHRRSAGAAVRAHSEPAAGVGRWGAAGALAQPGRWRRPGGTCGRRGGGDGREHRRVEGGAGARPRRPLWGPPRATGAGGGARGRSRHHGAVQGGGHGPGRGAGGACVVSLRAGGWQCAVAAVRQLRKAPGVSQGSPGALGDGPRSPGCHLCASFSVTANDAVLQPRQGHRPCDQALAGNMWGDTAHQGGHSQPRRHQQAPAPAPPTLQSCPHRGRRRNRPHRPAPDLAHRIHARRQHPVPHAAEHLQGLQPARARHARHAADQGLRGDGGVLGRAAACAAADVQVGLRWYRQPVASAGGRPSAEAASDRERAHGGGGGAQAAAHHQCV
mmetsp:Transcript_18404/g.55435  ORF Transcript_18404/g.55435 Transcript_18404/m.55435 type:complete len:392 (-) Transcript_18404:3878-5053(-)